MNVLSTKFKALALFSSIALLTACNQPTKAEQAANSVTASSITSSAKTTESPSTGHDMSKMNDMGTASSPTASQPTHVAEYMQSMNTMHEQMMSASHIANPDVAFATGMIAHHQGAIDMAKIQLKYGKDSEMRALAENIIKAQQIEITQTQTWLSKHKDDKAPTNTAMPEMDMKSHDAMMQGIMDSDPDVAFAKGMIPHHQGAIDMANTELKMGKDKEMLQLAKQIKSAQDPEIKQMQAWLDSKKTK